MAVKLNGRNQVVSGQGAGHIGTTRIDPRWLLDTGLSSYRW
jgi:hypothetical protein